MAGEKIKKQRFKWRILKNIFLVLACSMGITAFAGFFYFERVVREQEISDEASRIQQVSNQIYFMIEDIRKFADSIIVDDNLQTLLEQTEYATEFDRLSNGQNIARRLVFYNSLRTYIHSSILIMGDGSSYGSSYSVLDKGYVEEKLQISEVGAYFDSREGIFSAPYLAGDFEEQVIGYRINMWDKHQYGTLQGILYLEIRLEYFLEQIRTYAQGYENVCLIDEKNQILFEQDPGDMIQNYLKGGKNFSEGGSERIEGGYLIGEKIDDSGWILCTIITDGYLWGRSRFVLHFFLFTFLFSMILILLSTSRVLENMIRPVTDLSRQMEKIEYGNYGAIESVRTGDEIQTLYECFQSMLDEIQKGETKRIQYEKQQKEMEFDIMLSQINPHYLYNVLNTVVYMASANKEAHIVKIVNSLIYSLQETLSVGDGTVVTTVAKELELTRCYLTIQEYRYPGMFRTELLCPEKLEHCMVPKTIIQPLVENAILHGILPGEQEGTVCVRIEEVGNTLQITVRDDGIGMDEKKLKQFLHGQPLEYEKSERKHIGISNVRDRISYLYGAPFGMAIDLQEAGGTCVCLILPLKFKEREERENK